MIKAISPINENEQMIEFTIFFKNGNLDIVLKGFKTLTVLNAPKFESYD